MDISVLLKFHGYEYGYALNIVTCYIPTYYLAYDKPLLRSINTSGSNGVGKSDCMYIPTTSPLRSIHQPHLRNA